MISNENKFLSLRWKENTTDSFAYEKNVFLGQTEHIRRAYFSIGQSEIVQNPIVGHDWTADIGISDRAITTWVLPPE